jgi:uncharacterized membrane protein required for colicin V production
MIWVDLIILILILITGYIGYRNGFLKELYNLVIFSLSMLFAFLLKSFGGKIIIDNINININEPVFLFFKTKIANTVGMFVTFIIFYLLFKIIFAILKKKEIIVVDKNFFPYGGMVINVFEVIFLISIIGFTTSFMQYLNVHYFENSLLLKSFYRLNYSLYSYGNELHTIIRNGIEISNNIDQYDDLDELLNDPKVKEILESLFETGIIDEDLIVEGSKEFLKKYDINQINIEEYKDTEIFKIIKDLYKENIITEQLLRRIVDENNLTDFDIDGLIQMLEE